MAAIALFDVLPDFGKRSPPAGSFDGAKPRPDARPESDPRPDHQEMARAEVARAEAALEERLGHAHRAELEMLRLEHAEEIELMRRRFGENAGETIAARIDEMESRIGALASAAAARILGSLLSEDLRRRSIDSLAHSIREAVGDREAVRIKVHGPQTLFAALRDAVGARAGHLDYTETAGFDLTVSVDGALFETRLSEWSAGLSEALS
jgi:hypothetical protein